MQAVETDEEIITRYKNGEEELFKMLIERYSSSLFNFAIYLTNLNYAPDLVQEVFIKVWKNLNKFNEEKASFKTWIFTIAKNTATDFLRKKKSLLFSDIETTEEDNSFEENILDENLLQDEALQKLQDIDLLNELLAKLDINYRTILLLHYQEDMTFEEIGKILKKPLNTVKSQHRRAILDLRKLLS
ncbi:MAG: RNA polymerase, sigma-24 subunit, ECF subfamily [Candidatus Nomurabacteria bacterium GW2011_GWE1_32_28]|uniref:RNA polymerase sigma factor n=1 Tax=Candidatus Nomurabacteria bacterium GW2011_GWF1_31_48 TaxID=1618767 RepID=A0A0F9YW65_9BACT|nr:MAG: RNA polymerase, sigma-24 subunit, ECF subfamily [Candidatus Nomurabacteria bacterium GW2011_GWF2_30_133]KKP28968.1 MAG: RNA polymerase, sigma-24 subunit, ECF subfamily [Candidatus Nomurabacteria bacterium GW2011_GWE2_31_40]KKP30706.1 MAG: RNA polymerase, sigma-24 subunit, ECF subfamily [Candidatus Nomurabacteria bacterium GW2011_GWF1_31_48]KKP35224.1 MAG: RNA polymerase, sigma-24 subunit, ECF subfamily [Candidatus Nomurabacteria bacterium GW2011_GWE1_32_28]HAS80531.1 hypothetical protei